VAVERTAVDWNPQGCRRSGQSKHGQESSCWQQIMYAGDALWKHYVPSTNNRKTEMIIPVPLTQITVFHNFLQYFTS
jgi:hypothetical protein